MDTPTAQPVVGPSGALAEIRLDDDGRFDEDIHCRKCSYNLRGLSPEGRCPECGTATGRSLQGDHLRFAEPVWVGTLASGMNWIFAAIAVGIIGGITGAILEGAASPAGGEFLSLEVLVIVKSIIGLVGY